MFYVISSKNAYAVQRLKQEAKVKKQKLRVLNIQDLLDISFNIAVCKKDVLYVRNPYLNGSPKNIPQIIKLAKEFKKRGGRVVDANIVKGNIGQGKWVDYKKLKNNNLPIPMTEKFKKIFKSKILNPKSYILKWIYGFKAHGTFLIKKHSDFKKIPTTIPVNELMIQEYIQADYEYKVITVGYKALPVILRFKYNKKLGRVDFASYNTFFLEGEGRVRKSNKIKNLIELSEKASKVLGRELAKVDILEDNSGNFYILEVNRFPGIKSFEELTKYNVTREFMRYLLTTKTNC